jgi:hypothetical protein
MFSILIIGTNLQSVKRKVFINNLCHYTFIRKDKGLLTSNK